MIHARVRPLTYREPLSASVGWHGKIKPSGSERDRSGREGRHNTAGDIAAHGSDCESATGSLLKHSSEKAGTAGAPTHGGPLWNNQVCTVGTATKMANSARSMATPACAPCAKIYGQHFAEGCGPDEKLSDVLHKLDEPSLSKLVHDHEHGKLTEKVATAG